MKLSDTGFYRGGVSEHLVSYHLCPIFIVPCVELLDHLAYLPIERPS